jgi:hypothetical protein
MNINNKWSIKSNNIILNMRAKWFYKILISNISNPNSIHILRKFNIFSINPKIINNLSYLPVNLYNKIIIPSVMIIMIIKLKKIAIILLNFTMNNSRNNKNKDKVTNMTNSMNIAQWLEPPITKITIQNVHHHHDFPKTTSFSSTKESNLHLYRNDITFSKLNTQKNSP